MRFQHTLTNLENRQIHLMSDSLTSKYYLYDAETALFAEVDDNVAIAATSHNSDAPYLPAEAAEVLTALAILDDKNKLGGVDHAKHTERVLAMSLGIRADCNMGCTYCY